MADIAIFRINYKSDFILTLQSDAGWMTPFCIKFWTGAPSQAYFAGFDGTTYTHCAPVDGEPTKLLVQFDDHHLPIGDLKFQIGYHFTVADFPTTIEDEVINQAAVIIEQNGEPAQVMLDFNGETAPEIEFSLPAYANEAQRIANEEQRIANEEQRIANEEARIAAETIRQQNEAQRISNEESRVTEFARLKQESETATADANAAAALANEKAALADDKAALADAAATLANEKAQLAADKAALAQAAATLANEKAALAQQKAAYAQTQGDYAKAQGDYAKEQGEIAEEDHERAEADHTRAESDHTQATSDHTQAGTDHSTAVNDHTQSVTDHTKADTDHTRAESDHTQAASDHTQAGADHTRADSDHTTASADHTQAGQDHTRAESDHTRAESDHAAVEVYVDSLGAFDISAYHATGGVLAKYADLAAALGTNGANIPDALRKGGMSVKYVQSSDNKYVCYMLNAQSWSKNVANWEKTNLEKEVFKLDEELYGRDKVVLNIQQELEGYQKYEITEDIPKFKAGEEYVINSLNGNVCGLVYKTPNSSFINIGRPEYIGGNWVYPSFEFPDNVIYLALESRAGSTQNFDVNVEYAEEIIGIVERVTDIEGELANQHQQLIELGNEVDKIETLEEDVQELDVDINGQNTSVTVYENDSLYIKNAYGHININTFISDFEIGKTYVFSAEGGALQYKLFYSNAWHTLNPLNENPIEVLWTSEMATSTIFQFYSREGSATTFSVSIKSKGVVTSGLKERVTILEGKVETIEEDLSDLKKRNPDTNGIKLYMEGASFVDWNIGFDGDNPSNKGNGWFELACERLGYVAMNKARSGSSIIDFARGISGNEDAQGHKVNAPWTDEEFEQFDILCIMHVRDYNVADTSVLKESYDGTEPFLNTPLKATARVGYICDNLIPEYYAQAYDYVLKEYARQCYACKDKVGSRWYGEKMGKPFKVICCTHWHDGRVTFNTAIRTLREKWGFELCEFDKHIGFSKEQVNPVTQEQQSVLYCNNGIADTEVINGITFGWHQTRGKDAYIQKQMASIFVNSILPILYT